MSAFLLDTQIVLWASAQPERLNGKVMELLGDSTHEVVVSAVSIAEMVIKQAIGKLSLPVTAMKVCLDLGVDVLPLSAADCQRLATIPLLHKDPFDRLLIAQCAERKLTMITADRHIWKYSDISLVRND
jgi:PIN domain nuclease of toxin-antitoxin system